MRSRELKTHTQNQFAFFHFTLHVQKHKAVTYLTPVLTTSMEIRIVNDFIFLQTTCVPVIIYLKGNASFQYHLGWFPKHLLKKISSRHAQLNNSVVCPGQETACADPGPDSQATLLAGWWLRGPFGETAAKAPLAAVQSPVGQRKRRQRIWHSEGLQSPEKKA